jgi:moderate conductance mechanosensitive channel
MIAKPQARIYDIYYQRATRYLNMDLGQFFNSATLLPLALPAGIGIAIIAALYFLRRFLYVYVHRLAAKTVTQFDDIMIQETRLATLLWCIWLGIWAAYKIAATPLSWVETENKVISVIFAAFGIYTLVMIIMAILKWYKVEICPRTTSSLDDAVMSVLIFGTPLVGGVLGVIALLNLLGYKNDVINGWLEEKLPTLGFLVVLAVVLLLLTILLVPKAIYTAVRNSRAEQTEDELKKRADTLTSVTVTTMQIAIIFIFILMIIPQVAPNVSIAPMLTGAGVLGLAVGFGAQSVVKDVLAGLFIIMENQYRKGDVVRIAGETGVVEEINLRRTVLRDLDGVYHVVPNGEIKVSSNMTKQYSRVNLVVSVDYETDLDKANAVIDQVGRELAEDPKWKPCIVSPPKAIRVDNLGESGIDIRIQGDVKPSRQWDVSGELRLRLKKAFDKAGIQIPYPHTHVIFDQPFVARLPNGEAAREDKNQTQKT